MKNKCSICKKNETEISCDLKLTNGDVTYIETIHACEECLERSKDNYIFVCVNCGRTFERNKNDMIIRLSKSNDPDDKDILYGLQQTKNEQVISGVSSCIVCDTEGNFNSSNTTGNA